MHELSSIEDGICLYRWSDIASHLEGRTDNDVKNLWNTQIKKRLSQLKAQNLSSLPISFSSNTQVSCSTNNNVELNMSDLTNMGFLHSTIDDYENGNIVLRFGDVTNGNMGYNSCSASSCEGSELNLNDQENSSWKPNINILSNALNLPHAELKAPKINDSNNFLWSNMQGSDHQMHNHLHGPEAKFTTAEHNSYDHSLSTRSCSSSNNIMSLGIPFLQPSQLPLLPADDDRVVATCVANFFDLQCQESHQAACTITIASLESSSCYAPVETDGCALANDNEECCSLQQSCVIPSTVNRVPELPNQTTKDEINTIDNLLSAATAATINCNPLRKTAHNYNDDHQNLHQQNLQCGTTVAGRSMNANIYNAGDNRGMTKISDPPALGLVPVLNAISASSDQDHSMWGEGQSEDLHQLQSANYVNLVPGAGVAGWDIMSECSNIMAHFSFPDWCKHLLHMSTDLL